MFDWLFATPPKVGSTWNLEPGNPFDDKCKVTILEVKNGWVKYKFKWGSTSALTIRSFREIYTKEED